MHGEKISQLAHDAKTDQAAFKELLDKVSRITNKVVRKYTAFAEKQDLISMCYISLTHSVRTFDKDKGLFEPHYLQRALQEVKREVIKNSLIRIPEAIINLNSKMETEDKEVLLYIPEDDSPDYDEEKYSQVYDYLAKKYSTTVRQIRKVRDIKYVVPTLGSYVMDSVDQIGFFSDSESIVENNMTLDKIDKAMEGLDSHTRKILQLHFGILGGQALPFTKIATLLNISVNEVRELYKLGIEYLQSDEIKGQLEGLI